MTLLGALVLVVTWGAAWCCARALVDAWAPTIGAPARTAPVVAAALLAVVPGTLCRVIGDLPLSMDAAALVFIAVTVRLRMGGSLPPAAGASVGGRQALPAWPAVAVAVALVGLVAHGAVVRNFFDDEAHVPFALVIARGVVPPEHPLAAGQVVPYHWGIDALYAQLIVGGVRPDRAIDIVTIASIVLLLGAASVLGTRLADRVGATLAMILVPLAGSPLALPLHEQLGPFQLKPVMYPSTWVVWLQRPPPLTADFFQHPQGLAFSIVIVVFLLATAQARQTRAFGAVLLAMLSLVQAVHFLVLGFGLLVAAIVTLFAEGSAADARPSRNVMGVLVDLGLLAAALAGAILLGGFFSPQAGTGASLMWGASFFHDPSALAAVAHHVVVFGLPLVLLPLALRGALERTRITLVAGAGIAFALPNVVVYAWSWDIVKLYSAAGFLAAIALTWTFALAWKRGRVVARGLIVIAVAATIAFPLVWLCTRTVWQGVAGIPVKNDWRLRDDVLRIGAALRPLIARDAKVLVNDVEHARMTGLFAPGFDAQKYLNGHLIDFARTRALMTTRSEALQNLDPALLEALDVDFALFTPRDIVKLGARGRERLRAMERVDVALPSGVTLYRIRQRAAHMGKVSRSRYSAAARASPVISLVRALRRVTTGSMCTMPS